MRLFRRPQVRYAETPDPVTPYQRAAQAWDERIGSARVQARNWRLLAFCVLALNAAITAGLFWLAKQSRVTPYVVEVSDSGLVRAVGEAAEHYKPVDAQIAFHLTQFITDVRSLSIDPIVVRQNWLNAYAYTTDRGATALNAYAQANDPFASVGQKSIAVEISSVVRASDKSFQLRWIERTYVSGGLAGTERWTAILTTVLQPPRNIDQLRRNPLGIYVDALNWNRELDTSSGKKP
jgi:type IV secretion system protein VirB5